MIIVDVNYTSPIPNSNRIMMTLSLNCTNQDEASDIYRTLQRMSGNESRQTQLPTVNMNARNYGAGTVSTARSIRSVVNFSERDNDGAEVVDMMGNEQAPTVFIENPTSRTQSNAPAYHFQNNSSPAYSNRNVARIFGQASSVAQSANLSEVTNTPVTPNPTETQNTPNISEPPIQVKPPSNPIEDLEIID